MIAWSVGVPSSVTRIVVYTVSSFRAARRSAAGDDVPGRLERDRQTEEVHDGDDERAAPAEGQQDPSVPPRAHPFLRAREVEQRKHRERELEAEHHLAEDQQIVHAAASA